jgi:RHS repeat-associated protein
MTRVTTAVYGAANLATSMQAPDGTSTTIFRDVRGNPKSIKDAAGLTSTPVFDDFGRIQSASDPRTGTTNYGYYTGTNSGYLHTATTSSGSDTYQVDARGNITHITDASGKNVSYTVNKADQVEVEQKGIASSTAAYDAAGNLKTRSVLAGNDPVTGAAIFSTTSYSIDEAGRLMFRTADNRTTQYGYDAASNLKTVAEPSTADITYGYDGRGRMLTSSRGTKTTTFVYDEDNARTAVINSRGKLISLETDGFSETVGSTNPLKATNIARPDANGRPVETRVIKTLANGDQQILRWSKQEYDALGRPTKLTQKRFTTPLALPKSGDPTGGVDVVSQTIYDDAARTVTDVDARGFKTVTEFDGLGRAVRMTDPAGNAVATEYNANGTVHRETASDKNSADGTVETHITTFDYDEDDRLIAVTDSSNPAQPLLTKYTYDQRGNLTDIVDPEGRHTSYRYDIHNNKTGETDPNGSTTVARYDAANRLVGVTDANHSETTFDYDEHGNLLSRTNADRTKVTFTYDENNNLLTTADENGTSVTYAYDDADHLIGKTARNAAGVGGPSQVSLTVDDFGRTIHGETDAGVVTEFSFDSLGNRLTESLKIGSGPNRVTTKSYDDAGNAIAVGYPSGLGLRVDYDGVNRIHRIADAAGATVYATYDDVGARLVARSGRLAKQKRAYDPARRLTEVIDSKPCSGDACTPFILRSVAYDRSPSGRKNAVRRPDLHNYSTYEYDPNSAIVAERHGLQSALADPRPDLSIQYDIDAALNFRSILETDASGRASKIDAASNARNQYVAFGGLPLSYDANGNLKQRSGITLTYDVENRLVHAQTPAGEQVDVLYDVDGRKVRATTTRGTVPLAREYVYSGSQIIEEYAGANLDARYIKGREVDEIVEAQTSSRHDGTLDVTLFPIQDEKQSVERLVDTTGATVERYEYASYGRTRVLDAASKELAASAVGWRYLFQGRELYDVLNAYDFRARVLWPQLGRFGQPDPLGFVDSTNVYAFGNDNFDQVDPFGLEWNARGKRERQQLVDDIARFRSTLDDALRPIVAVSSSYVPGLSNPGSMEADLPLVEHLDYTFRDEGMLNRGKDWDNFILKELEERLTSFDKAFSQFIEKEQDNVYYWDSADRFNVFKRKSWERWYNGTRIAGAAMDAAGAAVAMKQESEAIAGIRHGETEVPEIHKNSLRSEEPTHVYRIDSEGSLYKVGESSQGTRKRDGKSKRAEKQVRDLAKATGRDFDSSIIKWFPNKAAARQYETNLIRRYTRRFGRPPGNPLDR